MENGRVLSHVPEEQDTGGTGDGGSASATAASMSALEMGAGGTVGKPSNHKPFFRRLSFKGLRRGKVTHRTSRKYAQT